MVIRSVTSGEKAQVAGAAPGSGRVLRWRPGCYAWAAVATRSPVRYTRGLSQVHARSIALRSQKRRSQASRCSDGHSQARQAARRAPADLENLQVTLLGSRTAHWTWTAAMYAAGPLVCPCWLPPTQLKTSQSEHAPSERQALDLTVRLTSARSVRYVRGVMRRLRPRADVPAVRDFTAEVRQRLPAAAGHAAPR
jgi:hypothetical protein